MSSKFKGNELLPLYLILLMFISGTAIAGQNSEEKQLEAQLDFACEKARAKKLYPMRLKIFEECMVKYNNENYCNGEAGKYNADRINSPPRFYDLPECVKVFEYRKSLRIR